MSQKSSSSTESIVIKNEELHGYSDDRVNPVELLPTQGKRVFRVAYDNSANTRGPKTLPHFGADVMPAFRRYLAEHDYKATFERFRGFVMMNVWDTADGMVRGYEAYNAAIEELTDRAFTTLGDLTGTEPDREWVNEQARCYIQYVLKCTYEGMLAEYAAIQEVANALEIMDREVSEDRHAEASGIDGWIGGIPVQVKSVKEGKRYTGPHALITWEKVGEDRNHDMSVQFNYDPEDFEGARESEKVTEDDIPDFMLKA